MKEKESQSSSVLTIITAGVIFLTLALFGKSNAAGLLIPVNGDSSQISIKSHDVKVVINNGFARTEIDQIFMNDGAGDLEAIYSFPLPKQASLSEVTLWIDNKEVVGEVLAKEKAKQIYEDQKAQGKQTALAEKNDFKTFDISVYPVKAHAQTRVRVVYYQPLNIDLNIGRYVYPLQEGGVDDERIAFWSVDDKVKESFTFDLILKSAQPIKDVRVPGYAQALLEKVTSNDTEGSGNNHVYHARLDYAEGTGDLSQDIVFYYRLDDTVPARIEIVPFKDAGESAGTFMMTITPGASLAPISEGVDWVFVLDKSGSMNGNKIQTLTDGVSRVIGKMSPTDRFRIVTFNNEAEDLTHGFINATSENVTNALATVRNINARGGTALFEGLKMGLKKIDSERTSSIILVTDGVANIGPTHHNSFLKLLAAKDVRLFTFVIGNSTNRPLLDNIAKISGGFAMDISGRDDIYGKILQAKNKVLYEALHNVTIKIKGGGVSKITPATPGSIYRGQQLVLFGKYKKPGPISVTLEAKISGMSRKWECDAILPDENRENPEIERLWALSAIDEVMEQVRIHGESDKYRNQVINLGTEYSLVTDYTSMVVLDEKEMENLNIQRNNAKRVHKEKNAQQQRQSTSVKNYRVDKNPNGGMFKGTRSPGVGSGPVGPWFIIVLAGCGWLMRRRR